MCYREINPRVARTNQTKGTTDLKTNEQQVESAVRVWSSNGSATFTDGKTKDETLVENSHEELLETEARTLKDDYMVCKVISTTNDTTDDCVEQLSCPARSEDVMAGSCKSLHPGSQGSG